MAAVNGVGSMKLYRRISVETLRFWVEHHIHYLALALNLTSNRKVSEKLPLGYLDWLVEKLHKQNRLDDLEDIYISCASFTVGYIQLLLCIARIARCNPGTDRFLHSPPLLSLVTNSLYERD